MMRSFTPREAVSWDVFVSFAHVLDVKLANEIVE